MPARPKTATADVLTPEQALAELLALDMDSRRTAVAKDVRSRSPRYRCIPAHDLADALGIPESRRPGSEWSFTRYARLMTVEEYASYNSPASEVIYMIEDSLDPERLEELVRLSEPGRRRQASLLVPDPEREKQHRGRHRRASTRGQ